MVSDKERREVARRFRELDYADLQESLICAYLDALGIEGYEDWIGIDHRLADLIDPDESGQNQDTNPDTVQKESPAVQKAPECDRDALLELADELEEDACWEVQSPGVDNCAWRLKDVCDRIREALGVES